VLRDLPSLGDTVITPPIGGTLTCSLRLANDATLESDSRLYAVRTNVYAAPGSKNPEFKAKWIAALESGEYEQGRNSLKTSDGRYCCLGVACVVAGASFSFRFSSDGFDYQEAVLDGKVISDDDVVLSNSFADEIGLETGVSY
jgi:hypothetical protein